jgi:diguanylate cyclase (GGDEF)-like protein
VAGAVAVLKLHGTGRGLSSSRVLLLWWAAAILAAAVSMFGLEHLTRANLSNDAEHAAVAWARHLATNVPDIDLVFDGELPSPPAQDLLTALRGSGGVLRFKFFDPDGRLALVSDSLGTVPQAKDGSAAESAHAQQVARSGHGYASIEQGAGKGQPELYSHAYVPVLHGAKIIGVVALAVDQSERSAWLGVALRRPLFAAGVLLALFGSLATALWHWRVQRQRSHDEGVRHLARHDMLTGAANHASFSESLARACATCQGEGGGLAVLCIDLDRFTEVNDAHGHGAGDQLLRQVALRLGSALRGNDLLARLAGDRFAVLQREAIDATDVEPLAQRIVHSLAQPHTLAGVAGAVSVTATVGAALFGADGRDASTLLHRAEQALLQAKAGGPARWGFYDAELGRTQHERRSLAADLKRAIAEGSLRLHFQPVFDIDGQRLVSYEALARWPHPSRGFVPPVTFIALAEETGQIEALGRWVLHSACAEAAAWPAHVTVAVNLSPAQFRGDGQTLVQEVRAALAAAQLAPQRLELEITESLLMGHTDQVLQTLAALQALGVRIAMDDFGTGYSSLAYLWRFPFDKLKIDRAFTQGLGQDGKVDVIVRSIITLAHTLAMRVNAEGVETEGQRAALHQHGCDELQGFLLGRPQPPEQLVHLAVAPAIVTVD